MRHILVLGALMLAAPAFAQVASVGPCEVQTREGFPMAAATCEVTNLSPTPIASLAFGFRIVEDGRAEPWLEAGFPPDLGEYSAEVPEGIAPGATVPVEMWVHRAPEGADLSRVRYEIEILGALDPSGALIE